MGHPMGAVAPTDTSLFGGKEAVLLQIQSGRAASGRLRKPYDGLCNGCLLYTSSLLYRKDRIRSYFYARRKETVSVRKLKKYKPTAFMAKSSHYDKPTADYAVSFIEALCHKKGKWAGQTIELME